MSKLKYIVLILLLDFCCMSLFAQSQQQRDYFIQNRASLFLGIWDKENSSKTIKIDSISYDEIPKDLDFRGTVVEALKWSDKSGDNILIQSISGWFPWKDYDDIGSTSYMIQDKWEIYAYLFQKKRGETYYKRIWRLYDYNECFGVDWYAGFIPKGTTITDIDNNGIAEISMPYVLICRGGMDPGTMKIIMYEGNKKYAVRGETEICVGDNPYGGDYKLSDNLNTKTNFKNFLLKLWNIHKCENGRFY